ncbi:MAG: glutamine--fructose-6-phosphate transaminase (isomerizing) [Bacilli bacterium]|nr:glutamine--fructose-6-phosphate transaminase (isomerizing) [Bacilli bacterium]
MCGIFGYVGKKVNIERVLIDGLKTLEYRGYDSAGIAFVTDKVEILKTTGKISALENMIDEDLLSNIGIAHTRWATHGNATTINAHPHRSGSVTIIHNGIIENYLELKEMLIKEGYSFVSETDTEIVAALLDYLKSKDIWSNLEVIKEMSSYIKGSYALGIIFDDELDTLYATRKDSPLIIGVGEEENLIASDVAAIINFTKNYFLLNNYDIVKITNNGVDIYNENLEPIRKNINTVYWNVEEAEKNGFPHFMLKEIYEEGKVLKDTINEYVESIDSFINKMPDFSKYDNIHIVACGSAMHAGLIGKHLIENYAGIKVDVEIASEYRYKKEFYNDKTLVILISQSGETADTIASLRKANEDGIDTLGIVNVVGSTIARESKNVLYIRAGVEIAVATTKAYLLQVAMLELINLKLMLERNLITGERLQELLQSLSTVPKLIDEVIAKDKNYIDIAKYIYEDKDLFYIGRGIDYAISLEGSLKLKEISYMHSEAYQAGELKHGTISLIEEGTPVIAIMTDPELSLKTISNIKEVVARGAKVILITTNELDGDYDFIDQKVVLPKVDNYLVPLLTVVPLQLIAYHVADLRKCDIDKPRNLAKSVTVE